MLIQLVWCLNSSTLRVLHFQKMSNNRGTERECKKRWSDRYGDKRRERGKKGESQERLLCVPDRFLFLYRCYIVRTETIYPREAITIRSCETSILSVMKRLAVRTWRRHYRDDNYCPSSAQCALFWSRRTRLANNDSWSVIQRHSMAQALQYVNLFVIIYSLSAHGRHWIC